MHRLLQVTLAAWAGSLWTICAFVAPSLFSVLSERSLAGAVAGHLFRVESWLGLGLGLVTLLLIARGAVNWIRRLDYALVLIAALAPLCSELILRSLMDAARVANDMQRFGMLHGVSALLFGIACVCSLLLIWRLAAPPRR